MFIIQNNISSTINYGKVNKFSIPVNMAKNIVGNYTKDILTRPISDYFDNLRGKILLYYPVHEYPTLSLYILTTTSSNNDVSILDKTDKDEATIIVTDGESLYNKIKEELYNIYQSSIKSFLLSNFNFYKRFIINKIIKDNYELASKIIVINPEYKHYLLKYADIDIHGITILEGTDIITAININKTKIGIEHGSLFNQPKNILSILKEKNYTITTVPYVNKKIQKVGKTVWKSISIKVKNIIPKNNVYDRTDIDVYSIEKLIESNFYVDTVIMTESNVYIILNKDMNSLVLYNDYKPDSSDIKSLFSSTFNEIKKQYGIDILKDFEIIFAEKRHFALNHKNQIIKYYIR
jgi:hypothetical protein